MPISNPLLTINESDSKVLIRDADPIAPPMDTRLFWLNSENNRLWISKGTQSLDDWVSIGGDIAQVLGAIVVENNAVVTDGKKVIWEID
ncbi:MAG: hypothetical protein DCE90_18040 [Pseudanabaena sp.]|nr:MAG: hypothetical protein DCE90_18040 [Pseudanabaena sp.]